MMYHVCDISVSNSSVRAALLSVAYACALHCAAVGIHSQVFLAISSYEL